MASLSKGVALMLLVAAPAAARAEPIALVPHRAVYDLSLADASGQMSETATSMSGRMVFEFTGNACEGYTVNFRFVLESADAENASTVTDLRTSTHEGGDGAAFQFLSKTYTNEVLTEETKGTATRGAEGDVTVDLVLPEAGTTDLGPGIDFPSRALIDVIAAAREGRTVLESMLFDGSDSGDKAYRVTAVIGRPVEKPAEGIAAGIGEVPRWPVSMSYFDVGATGDLMPTYVISFDLWENGVSTDLLMDYGDFALKGDLAAYEALPATPCEP